MNKRNPRRLYNADGTVTELGDTFDGWHLHYRAENFVTTIVREAEQANVDLRDLAALLHGAIDIPISRALLQRKKRIEDAERKRAKKILRADTSK